MKHSAMVMLMLVLVMGVAAGCSISSRATDFSGLKNMDGDKVTHINTRNYAVHAFVTHPFIGDATLQNTVKSFTEEAKKAGATKVMIVQSNETTLWWLLPPLTLLLTPVTVDVAGDAIP
jgi:ABC-type sugar transport system substrate-binding protein